MIWTNNASLIWTSRQYSFMGRNRAAALVRLWSTDFEKWTFIGARSTHQVCEDGSIFFQITPKLVKTVGDLKIQSFCQFYSKSVLSSQRVHWKTDVLELRLEVTEVNLWDRWYDSTVLYFSSPELYRFHLITKKTYFGVVCSTAGLNNFKLWKWWEI